ncbi:MAG: WYL domain-containing protein [Chloroflexi bacterium]|nr:WYL domain-containing protein [Chloroflexota bacterium]
MTIDPATPLDDLTLAFLDVETTGLAPRYGDRVCEIAVVRSRVDLVQATFATLVNPERAISPSAAAVNGIRDEDARDAPRFAEIVEMVRFMLREAVVVCHNAPFDLGFVSSEMQRAGCEFAAPAVIDTLQLARRCFSFASNSLPRVAAALAIPTPNAHRALGDALTTREVLNRFVEDLWKRGVRTLGDLQNAQGELLIVPASGTDIPLPPAIAEALGSRKRLFLKYVDGQGEVTERWVTPREIAGIGETLSLVAFCHLREEIRQFRLDRIVQMEIET